MLKLIPLLKDSDYAEQSHYDLLDEVVLMCKTSFNSSEEILNADIIST